MLPPTDHSVPVLEPASGSSVGKAASITPEQPPEGPPQLSGDEKKVVGDYTLGKRLGREGRAEVRLAQHNTTREIVRTTSTFRYHFLKGPTVRDQNRAPQVTTLNVNWLDP